MTEEKEDNTLQGAMSDGWSKNWLVPTLLLMLRQWNSYGYELLEKMTALGIATMNPGSFYRTLRRMEKEGMVSSNWDTSEGGPARRRYSITDAGEAYLKYWMDSLDQYQKMMNLFFQLYPGVSRSQQENKQQPGSSEK